MVWRYLLGERPVIFLKARLKEEMLEKPESKAMSMIWVSGLENRTWAFWLK